MAVELFRVRCELFGDLAVDEKDVFRLKPDDALDVVELKVDSFCVTGDPLLLVLGLVDLVDVLPNMLPPLKIPPFEALVCISAQRF